MAILKSVVDVNNGNTGWTNTDVMDALETVFANLGFHGGSASSGVPQALISPGNVIGGYHESWRAAGGGEYWTTAKTWRYDVTAQGTTAYRWLRKIFFATWSYAYSENDGNYPNQIRIDGHGYDTGEPVHWAPGETDEARNISGLTLDTVYYVIRVNNNYFKLAATESDANANTNITLTAGGYSSNNYAAKSNIISYFRDPDNATFDNRTINVGMTDTLEVNLNSSGAGNFHFCYDTDDYDANKYVVEGLPGQDIGYASDPTGTGSDSGSVVWDTMGYVQSYTAVNRVLFHPTETQEPGRKYIYANDTNSAMKGVINIYPQSTNRQYVPVRPFWDYEVPQNGGRSALKIRVRRYQESNSSYRGRLYGMEILSQGSGWTDNEVFTIPGDQIGATTPDYDVTFGVRSDETSSNAGDGTPAISVTNLGAGSNFFQKANSGRWAVLKNVNDASKTYGTTYYSFGIDTDTNNRICFNSGSGYKWLNKQGVQQDTQGTNMGEFVGQLGLDYMENFNYPLTESNPGSYWTGTYIDYCSSSTPTAYPLEIRVYRAQAPQDTNFAIIQFCQTINNIVQPYGAFTIYRGPTFGSNVWDLDYVYNGSMMIYGTGTRQINLIHTSPGNHYSYSTSDRSINEEPVSEYSVAREAFYGYLRDPFDPDRDTYSEYVCNIETDSGHTSDMYLYYRNSAYDQHNGNSVASEADYYKPFKGLPINERMVPCPYYLPDDFVMLQVSTTPGLTQFRTGDTVTIGGTETYEIIRASYQTQQNGLDGVDNNSTIGMLFLARIS
jgi:hypothetical protein